MANQTYIFHRRLPKDLSAIPYRSGHWVAPPGQGFSGTATPTINTIQMFCAEMLQNAQVTDLGLCVTTQQASSHAQMAIYTSDPVTLKPTGLPLGKTPNVGTTSAAAVSGTLDTPVNLAKWGLYWFAMNSDTASLVFNGCAISSNMARIVGDATLSNVMANQSQAQGYKVAQTFGTWPDLTSASLSLAISTVPAQFMKIK